MEKLQVFCKRTIEGQYPNGLAYSVHMSLNGEPLHNGYGMLFPKGTVDKDNRIVPAFTGEIRVASALINDRLTFILTGENWNEEGALKKDSDTFFTWITEDFISFKELDLLSEVKLKERTGFSISELRKSDTVEISSELAKEIKDHWILVPEKDCKYPKLKFPFSRGFGDPVFFLWKGEYYYIATNDNVDDIGFYVKKAHELEELASSDTEFHIILDKDEKRGLIQTFWAPEFHVINGDLYLIFAVSNENWGPQCHIMKLKENGDDLCDLSVWEKGKTPSLNFLSVPGEFGPGHNSFFCDRDGDWFIAFHGVTSFEERTISDGIRKVRYDKDNRPRFS